GDRVPLRRRHAVRRGGRAARQQRVGRAPRGGGRDEDAAHEVCAARARSTKMNPDDMLTALTRDEDDALRRLHERLADAADSDGLLEVAYRIMDSPVGSLLVAVTERGLVRVAYVDDGSDDALNELAARVSPRILERPASLDVVTRELDEYFSRRRR